MNFYFLIFEKFETLDLFGPVEIFGGIDNATLNYISIEGGTHISSQGVKINTEKAGILPSDSILIIPGGMGTRQLVKDEGFLKRLVELSDTSKYVLSVCTGSALLAAAGLLSEKKATSNKNAFDWVKSVGEAKWIERARWVNDGKFYTSSGVSAGIDMALGFVADCYGSGLAKKIAYKIEYIWNEDANNDPFARQNSI